METPTKVRVGNSTQSPDNDRCLPVVGVSRKRIPHLQIPLPTTFPFTCGGHVIANETVLEKHMKWYKGFHGEPSTQLRRRLSDTTTVLDDLSNINAHIGIGMVIVKVRITEVRHAVEMKTKNWFAINFMVSDKFGTTLRVSEQKMVPLGCQDKYDYMDSCTAEYAELLFEPIQLGQRRT